MLHTRIADLKEENRKVSTANPLLDAFDLQACKWIDNASSDPFAKEKQGKIISYLATYTTGHDERLKSALDEYSEALNYLDLKGKTVEISSIPRAKGKQTPDFKLKTEYGGIYVEMKTPGFTEGNLNYLQTVQDGKSAKASLERQVTEGKNVASEMIVVAPLAKPRGYDPFSSKYVIETILKKADQAIDEGQFCLGSTFLLLDLRLIPLLSDWKEESIPIYQEGRYKSMASGILWNVAFAKIGYPVFKPIEFEGKENIEGELQVMGILAERPYVKGMIFRVHELNGSSHLVGFCRYSERDDFAPILCTFCELVNDDLNTEGWTVLQKQI